MRIRADSPDLLQEILDAHVKAVRKEAWVDRMLEEMLAVPPPKEKDE